MSNSLIVFICKYLYILLVRGQTVSKGMVMPTILLHTYQNTALTFALHLGLNISLTQIFPKLLAVSEPEAE